MVDVTLLSPALPLAAARALERDIALWAAVRPEALAEDRFERAPRQRSRELLRAGPPAPEHDALASLPSYWYVLREESRKNEALERGLAAREERPARTQDGL